MSNKNESLGKTLFVVVALCLVCAVIVAGSAVGFKPMQQRNAALDMQRNVLDAAGLLQPDTNVVELFEQRVETKLVNLDTLEVMDSFAGQPAIQFDIRAAARDAELSESLTKAEDEAGIGRLENITQVYFINNEAGELETVVLHIRGYGLWGIMYGLMALESDVNTVRGINFYEHAETPGLGGEIQNPRWVASWRGKEIYAESGEQVAIDVTKNATSEAHDIDALSGATLTSNGVENLIQFWFSDQAYGPMLDKIRKGELTNG